MDKPYLALGCGSENQIIVIPYPIFINWLNDMSFTGKAEQIKHWNIVVIESHDSFMLRLKGNHQDVNLGNYKI